MGRRMTYEEKEAAREQREQDARLATRRREVDEFKQQRDKMIARAIYTRETAWQSGEAGTALWALVDDFERTKENLRDNVRRLQSRVNEITARLNDGRTGSGYSTVLGDLPADIEQQNAKLDALISAIAALSRVAGMYVREIYSAKANAHRALLVSIDVVRPAGFEGGYVVKSTQDGVDFFLGNVEQGFGLVVGAVENIPKIIMYADEDAAWFAAKTFVGDGRWL